MTERTGGNERERYGHKKSNTNTKRVSEFLPSAEQLEAYNYVVEGSAGRILTMFEAEQKHRHQWEANALKTHSFSTLLGQVLGFFIAITIFISAALLGMHGSSTTGALIWVFGLAIIVMAGMVWVYAKSMGQRPLFARPAMRAHFRPEKDLDPEGKGVYVDRRDRNS